MTRITSLAKYAKVFLSEFKGVAKKCTPSAKGLIAAVPGEIGDCFHYSKKVAKTVVNTPRAIAKTALAYPKTVAFGFILGFEGYKRWNALDNMDLLGISQRGLPDYNDAITDLELNVEERRLKNVNSSGKEFFSALAKHKADLMVDLELSEYEYNFLADVIAEIAKQESDVGKSPKYKLKNAGESLGSSVHLSIGDDIIRQKKLHDEMKKVNASLRDLGSDEIRNMFKATVDKLQDEEMKKTYSEELKNLNNKAKNMTDESELKAMYEEKYKEMKEKILKKDCDVLSRGITQCKISEDSEEVKNLYDKYGITYGEDYYETNLYKPQMSAVATMIRIVKGGIYRDYENKYLQSIQELAIDKNDEKVQKAIKRASELINDTKMIKDEHGVLGGDLNAEQPRRRYVLEALISKNGSKKEKDCLAVAGITAEDLEALRIYSKGIVLPKKAYIAARWRGMNIIPNGERADIASKNLINAVIGQGYMKYLNEGIVLPEDSNK